MLQTTGNLNMQMDTLRSWIREILKQLAYFFLYKWSRRVLW